MFIFVLQMRRLRPERYVTCLSYQVKTVDLWPGVIWSLP